MTRIFVDVPIDGQRLERLRLVPGAEVFIADPITERGAMARPVAAIRDVAISFCSFLPMNHSVMQRLALVQLASSGYEQIISLDLPARGVRARNARGVFDTSIAEWNIAMMVALARNLRQMIRNQDAHVWDPAAQHQAEIRGSIVGLWGYGGLGRQTARLAKALGMTVHVLTRTGVRERRNAYVVPGSGDPEGVLPDRTFTSGQEREFLKDLDFLILAMPLTKATRGIIGRDELRSLPRHAFLLNPARGPLVEEQSLLEALRERWIAGAALDTHHHYPLPPEHPLWALENVIVTPHISGSSGGPFFLQRMWDLFLENTERFLGGQPLLNELSAQELSGT